VSRAKHFFEWFWRGSLLADKKRSLAELGARAKLLAQRAHDAANMALNSAELALSADASGGARSAESLAEATASELYRQSCYWSLCAAAAPADESVGSSYVEAVWDTLDDRLLQAAAPTERSELLRTSLSKGSFVYFAELPKSERVTLSKELRKLAESLLVKIDEPTRAVNLVLLQRTWRLGLLFMLALVVFAGAIWERRTREARSDLARGAAWRTSSKFTDESLNCTSPAQECSETSSTFFCTKQENDPWIEFDLGSERSFSTVQVENRRDCCADRAVPLTVEVSEDHRKWKTVARKDDEFKTTWRGSFTPVKARWVRLRVHKLTHFHLARVQIFP